MTVQMASPSRLANSPALGRIGLTTARILLGSVFTLAGFSIVLMLGNPPPPPPGLAGTFATVFFQSHWVVFVDVAEFAAGLMLLANRFVPFALVVLAALLSNILVFHATMQPQTIAVPLILTALWSVLAHQHRATLLRLFK